MSILRIVVALIAMLLLPEGVRGAEVCLSATIDIVECDMQDEESDSKHRLTHSLTPMLSMAPAASQASNIVPIARTVLRLSQSIERSLVHSKGVSAIDSTTAARRYGLYNHKILFVSIARLYYLNRLMRLII